VDARVLDNQYKAIRIEVAPAIVAVPKVVSFAGEIKSIGSPIWEIGGRKVEVTRTTVIIGQPAVGMTAKVRALLRSNGTLLGLIIQVKNAEPEVIEFTGTVEKMIPNILGRWTISGRMVVVSPRTEIVGDPAVGDTVRVRAIQSNRVPLQALRIEKINANRPADRPTPTPTEVPTEAPTAGPTAELTAGPAEEATPALGEVVSGQRRPASLKAQGDGQAEDKK